MTGRQEVKAPAGHDGPHYLITDSSGLIVPCTLHARWCPLCPEPDTDPEAVERGETIITRMAGRRTRTP